jgi:pSer/pThr/pTyr-binding forkhead associated (FHA) protein
MPTLVFTTGPLAGRRLEVGAALSLGRELGDVVVDDPEVSRRHAVVRPARDDPAGLEIEDLGSLNGTWVNGRRIDRPTRLAPGDRVRVGDSFLEVEPERGRARPTVASPAPAAPAPPVPAAPVAAPAPAGDPLGAFAPPAARRRRRVATRRLTPTVLSFGAVVLTAVALLVYFAGR